MRTSRVTPILSLILVSISTVLGVGAIIFQIGFSQFLLDQEKLTAALLLLPYIFLELLVIGALVFLPIFGIIVSSISLKRNTFRPFFVTSLISNILILIGAAISFLYFLSQVVAS